MTTHSDVIVVGGGIAGLTVALAAADAGVDVRLVHAPRPGAASRASAGLLAPSLNGLPASLLDTARNARDFYPPFLSSLLERTGVRVSLDRAGIIELGSETALRSAHYRNPHARALDQRELADLEPSLSAHRSAVLHPRDGAVDALSLMRALDVAVEGHARISFVRERAAELVTERPGLLAVRTSSGATLGAPAVVLATGAWSDVAGLPAPMPVRPLLGELLTLASSRLRHAVSAPGGYLVPGQGCVLVGATSEDTGFEVRTSPRGHADLRAFAERVVPSLATARLRDHWCGLRPVTPDGLPVLGPDPHLRGLFHAAGYSRNGILFAPWAAARLAAVLAGDRDASGGNALSNLPAEFSPSRFTYIQ